MKSVTFFENNPRIDNGTEGIQDHLINPFLFIRIALLVFLYWLSQANFMAFHVLSAIFTISVAWALFMIVWNVRAHIDIDAIVFLGIAMFFIGCLDLGQPLVYTGTEIVDFQWANEPSVQLWLAARTMHGLSLLAFAYLLDKHCNVWRVFIVFAVVTALIFLMVLQWRVIPPLYTESAGSSMLKWVWEGFIVVVFAASLIHLYFRRNLLDQRVAHLLAWAIVFSIGAEIAHVWSGPQHGPLFIDSHYLNLISFVLVYLAMVRSGLQRPFAILFRRLQGSARAIQDAEIERTTILDHQPDHILLHDPDGRVQWANRSVSDFVGLSREDLIGKQCHDIWNQPKKICETCALKKTMASGNSENSTITTLDGECWQIRTFPILDTNGTMVRILEIRENITERMRVEKALRLSEEFFSKAFHQNNALMVIGNLKDGTVEEINEAVLRCTGLSREELVGRSFLKAGLVPDLEQKEMERLIQENGKMENVEILLMPESQNPRLCLFSGDTITVGGRQHALFSGIDVTDRKRAEQDLIESQRRLKTLMDNLPGMAFRCRNDSQWTMEFISDGCMKLTGYAPSDLIDSRKLSFNEIIFPQDRDSVWNHVQESITDRNFYEIEYRIVTKDGVVRWVWERGVGIWKDDGALTALEGFISDLTEKREMEDMLRQAQKMEAIGALAGGIAHDFNNILFPMVGFAEMLREDLPEDSPMQEHVHEILNASKRAKELVMQILAFSRQAKQEKKAIRIQTIVKEVMKLSRASLPSTIELDTHIDNDCRPVMADPTQIHQVIMNLITNGFHAMEETGGVMSVSLSEVELDKPMTGEHATLLPGRYILLTISDTGCGIPVHLLDSIFLPYFTTKEKNKGTGMGLSVVLGIVQSHGGDVRLESTPGQGTTFRVYLPCHGEESTPSYEEEEGPIPGGTERILLVDDEYAIVNMMHKMLSRLGYRLTLRTSSVEALKVFAIAPERFDIVITDLTMPNMTGDLLAIEIKRIRPEIPIIVCTGYSERLSEHRIRELDIQCIVHKPVVTRELASKIRNCLDSAYAGPVHATASA